MCILLSLAREASPYTVIALVLKLFISVIFLSFITFYATSFELFLIIAVYAYSDYQYCICLMIS